ncbi:MAG: hypothetical protein EXS13_14960 [Planctomycetes bacterium]|nr:hypothetical protein [Planctomycetota bacterium]
MPRGDEATQRDHERARRAVFGYLGLAILHETNNVLTVMAGVRQLLKAGIALSDRVGGMIDQQLARMEELVGWIRRLGPGEGDAGAPPRTAGYVLETVERVVLLAAKGRGVAVERSVEGVDSRPSDPEGAGLALLCLVLPALPVRGAVGMAIRLVARCDCGSVEFRVRCTPAPSDPSQEPEHERARAVVAAAGGVVKVSASADAWEGRLSFPAPSTS